MDRDTGRSCTAERADMYQEEYQPPVVPVDLPTFTQDIEFGLKAKQAYFFLDVRVLNIA